MIETGPVIETERLILRCWQGPDRPVFAAHCNDPEVMRYLGPLQTRAETDAALDRQNGFLADHGYCFWAVERRADAALLGFCGLKPGAPDTPIAGMIEIGWRFGRAHWGQGYAREAARASLDWGWQQGFPTIVAITAAANSRSRHLMEAIGMLRVTGGDFDHPAAAPGLAHHLLYRIEAPNGVGRA